MSSIRGICSIENCNNILICKKLCGKHYQKYHKYGNPLYAVKNRENHRLTYTPIYNTWKEIKSRCFTEAKGTYQAYGAEGITMCEGWRYSLLAFYRDIGDKPTPKHTIDRINSIGNYSCGKCKQCIENGWPMNCRWATRFIQSWNRGIRKTNTSGFIGVSRNQGKWLAEIAFTQDGKRQRLHLGRYSIPEEAAIAYDIACIFFRGDEAKTNIL